MFGKSQELRATGTAFSSLGLEEQMSKGLSEVARAKIELMNLIRDLENKVADANRALDRTRDLLRQLERANPEPRNRPQVQ
jgi:hypothetical protein